MNKQYGFTLIEMMIVVAIIGIIAAIAIPSYQDSVKKSRRADAQAALMGLAAALEREYTINYNYAGADADGNNRPDANVYPDEAPIEGNTKFYDLEMVYTTTTYTIYAKPKGAQAGDGPFMLRSTGQQGWAKESANSVADSAYTHAW